MKNKYVFVAVMLISILVASLGLTTIYVMNTEKKDENKDDLVVVTSFYPMYVATANVADGIEGIRLENLSQPQTGCLHDFQLTPEDMKLLSTADVFVVNGGGIEGFLTQVAEAYPKLKIVDASHDISLLTGEVHQHDHEHEEAHANEGENTEEAHQDDEEDHGLEEETHNHESSNNAHGWMSVSTYRQQVANIAEGLMEIDKVHKSDYEMNCKTYDEKLAELEKMQAKLADKIGKQEIVIFHEAYAYVARDFDWEIAYLLNLDEERQVSAGEVAELLEEIREHDIKLVLAEEDYGKDMGDLVEKETDVKVIYLDTLNRGDYSLDSYLDGMRDNLKKLEDNLSEE